MSFAALPLDAQRQARYVSCQFSQGRLQPPSQYSTGQCVSFDAACGIPLSKLPTVLRCIGVSVDDTLIPQVWAEITTIDTLGSMDVKQKQPVVSDSGEHLMSFNHIIKAYDMLQPVASDDLTQQRRADYLQFFHWMDPKQTGKISVADLRHVLTNLGGGEHYAATLSTVEVDHLLHLHGLLASEFVTVFEFIRLLMGMDGKKRVY